MIILIFTLHLSKKNNLETLSISSIKTYVYSTSSPILSHSISSKHGTIIQHQKNVSATSSKKITEHTVTQTSPETILLRILHDAIAEKQEFPESAIALKQSGIVTLGFIIYPNGELKNISLVKSSGINSLDEAALTAASSVTPMTSIHLYLKKPTYFTIEIEFV